MRITLAIIAAIAMIGLPIAMIWSMIAYFRTPPSKRRSGGSMSTAVGAALLALDRLAARPSIEHTVEALRQQPRLDEQSDE
jgi:hypothetical protein